METQKRTFLGDPGYPFPRAEETGREDKSTRSKSNKPDFQHVPEELYDFAVVPSAFHNLIADPQFHDQVTQMRKEMLLWVERTEDPLAEQYRLMITQKPRI